MSQDEFYLGNTREDAEPMIAHIAHDKHGFLPVPAMRVGGMAIFQGDILLGPAEHMDYVEAIRQTHRLDHDSAMPIRHLPPELKDAVTVARAWPGRKVYYQIDVEKKFDPGQGKKVPIKPLKYLVCPKKVRDAIKLWEATGLFKFYEEEHQDGYILFVASDKYESSLGRTGKKQDINLASEVGEIEKGKIAHEIGHALGLSHENQRRDALSYVKTYWKSIKKEALVNYEIRVEGLKVGCYDYESIMHYPKTSVHAKEKDGKLLEALDENSTADLGQRKGLAMSDLNAADAIYAEGVSTITVTLATGASGTGGEVFLGIGGREFRLATGSNGLAPNSDRTFTFEKGSSGNDPTDPPLSISYVLGLPMYLRLESGGAAWTVKKATVDLAVHEEHKNAWKAHPGIKYSLKEDQSGLTLGPDSGWSVHLKRQAPPGFTPHAPEGDKRKIERIDCSISTGTSPAKADEVYLGLAGREFRLAEDGLTADRQSTFTFKEGSSGTDPTQLTEAALQEFPRYIYAHGKPDWELKPESRVAVKLKGSDKLIQLKPAAGQPLRISSRNGVVCALKYEGAPPYPPEERDLLGPQPDWVDAYVSKIAVTVCGPKLTGAGTNGNVYLGLGGREFNLFFEQRADVLHSRVENPRCGMSLLDLDTYPAYIRKEGADDWPLASAYVTASFEDAEGKPLYRGTSLEKGLGIWWSRPTLDKGAADRPNAPMTASFTSMLNGLSLGGQSGRRCALVRTRPLIEVVFVLDTTGSMSGLIEAAKHMIRDIINEVRSAQPTPEIRIGLLGYRDRGDSYVTRRFDLTGDLNAVFGILDTFRAEGGGDLRESVNQALYEAVNHMSWTRASSVYKVLFLVGDAPPQTYSGEQGYLKTLRSAAAEGIVFNTVQCGTLPSTTPIWKDIARKGGGLFKAITQDGEGFDQKVLDAIRTQAAGKGIRYGRARG